MVGRKGAPCVELSTVAPPETEIASARELLNADPKQRRAKESAFAFWLHTNSLTEIQSLRGQSRAEQLELFLVHMARCSAASGEVRTATMHNSEEQSRVEVHEWGKEEMDKKLGAQRAEGLRSSGLLRHIPCRTTGLDAEFMRLWLIPRSLTLGIEAKVGTLGEHDKCDLMLENKVAVDRVLAEFQELCFRCAAVRQAAGQQWLAGH